MKHSAPELKLLLGGIGGTQAGRDASAELCQGGGRVESLFPGPGAVGKAPSRVAFALQLESTFAVEAGEGFFDGGANEGIGFIVVGGKEAIVENDIKLSAEDLNARRELFFSGKALEFFQGAQRFERFKRVKRAEEPARSHLC